MTVLPTCRPAELEARSQPWLIEELWGEQAVGILGGEPKCGKSLLALDIAVAVASGRPCLRRYKVERPGPVLLFPAEDAAFIVRDRLAGIAADAGADFGGLDIRIVNVPALRLDLAPDRDRLEATVEALAPRLLILDPLVRLHRLDENAVADISPLLGWLRELQRRFRTAVLLVHHARKGGAARPGQALRGSSDLHAWGASNLYLRRRHTSILLTAEHRNAPGCRDVPLRLDGDGPGPVLRLKEEGEGGAEKEGGDTPQARILAALAGSRSPLTRAQIRQRVRLRNATFGAALGRLAEQGRVVRSRDGFALAGDAMAALPGFDGGDPERRA